MTQILYANKTSEIIANDEGTYKLASKEGLNDLYFRDFPSLLQYIGLTELPKLKAKMRADKRVNPDVFEYRILTNDECAKLTGHAHILDRNGDIARVKIMSVKTWKRRPDIEIHCKFGLYECFTIRLNPQVNTELITLR